MFCAALLLQIQAGFAMNYLTTGGALFFSSLKRSASNSSKNTSRVLLYAANANPGHIL